MPELISQEQSLMKGTRTPLFKNVGSSHNPQYSYISTDCFKVSVKKNPCTKHWTVRSASLEVLRAALVRIQAFWDMKLRLRWLICDVSKAPLAFTSKINRNHSFNHNVSHRRWLKFSKNVTNLYQWSKSCPNTITIIKSKDWAMYAKRNTEARSHNQFCRGKTKLLHFLSVCL
jgi:hypothetical protein